MPSVERYDGPTYRCLRKFRNAQKDKKFPNNLRILILSAKYEMIFPETDEVFINLGKFYMQTLEGFMWARIKTLEASGGIGERTSQMKVWLEGLTETHQSI